MQGRLFLLAVAAATFGCASKYQAPADGPKATLVASWTPSELTTRGAQGFDLFGDEHCQVRLGSIANLSWAAKEPVSAPVAAQGRLYLRAGTMGTRAGTIFSCQSMVSFAPGSAPRMRSRTTSWAIAAA